MARSRKARRTGQWPGISRRIATGQAGTGGPGVPAVEVRDRYRISNRCSRMALGGGGCCGRLDGGEFARSPRVEELATDRAEQAGWGHGGWVDSFRFIFRIVCASAVVPIASLTDECSRCLWNWCSKRGAMLKEEAPTPSRESRPYPSETLQVRGGCATYEVQGVQKQ